MARELSVEELNKEQDNICSIIKHAYAELEDLKADIASIQKEEFIKTPLSQISFEDFLEEIKKHKESSRIIDAMKLANINSIETLLSFSQKDFKRIRGIGIKSVWTVRDVLYELGIKWK